MYYDFFGFREPPFSIAPDPRYLYLSDRHKEALAHLMYGVQGQGGFIVITGEVGTGKTTVCRCFIENAPEHVDIALILNPRLSARELLSAICDELAIPHAVDATIKVMVDLINQDLLRAHAAGRHKVLIIDEAQNLSADVLEQLRLLTNLETAEKKLLQIVLLGQPELQEILALPELRQLNQRVTARYHLDAIDQQEVPAYLQYRLGVAGLRGDLFSAGAVKALYRASKGVPRLINLISDRALLGAYAEGEHQITRTHINRAAREVLGNKHRRSRERPDSSTRSQLALVLASVLIAVIGTLWLLDRAEPLGRALAEEDSVQTNGVIQRDELNNGLSTAESGQTFSPEQHALALPQAFVELFAIWGQNYNPAAYPNACDHARSAGLRCLGRQGSRRSLEFIDRPALLLLKPDGGSPRYVVLHHLEGDIAAVAVPGGIERFPFRELERHWFGEFQVLWRVPEFMTGDGVYSEGTGQELWLGARMMELADRLAADNVESTRIKRLGTEQQVRWYQEQKGLTVDGIAGAMTVIQINNDLNVQVPRLVSTQAGNGR
ncbi:MAG TPA: AAA family ATPase [Marinobacter sp.]|nr:AAA family ATPase [Marinobacter sp.]